MTTPTDVVTTAADLVDRTTRAQGISPTVDDGAVLRAVADVVRRAERSGRSRGEAA